MNPRDFVEIKYGQWWEQVSQKATKKKHARNIRACLGAVDYHNQKKRPLNVLLIHGSGRSSFSSAAQELCGSPQSKTHQEQCILKSSLTSGSNFSVALNGQTRGTPS